MNKCTIRINTYTFLLIFIHFKLWIKVYNKKHNHYIYAWFVKIITFFKNIIFFFSLYNIGMVELTRKENNTNTKKEAF